MTFPESLSSSKFQPLNTDEAAMILGGNFAQAIETFHKKTTTADDGSQHQDLVADDTIG
jgi:hypothetical protein